jgi:hypothetical protein
LSPLLQRLLLLDSSPSSRNTALPLQALDQGLGCRYLAQVWEPQTVMGNGVGAVLAALTAPPIAEGGSATKLGAATRAAVSLLDNSKLNALALGKVMTASLPEHGGGQCSLSLLPVEAQALDAAAAAEPRVSPLGLEGVQASQAVTGGKVAPLLTETGTASSLALTGLLSLAVCGGGHSVTRTVVIGW